MDINLIKQLQEADIFTPITRKDSKKRDFGRPLRWVAFIYGHEDYHDLYLTKTRRRAPGEYCTDITSPCSIVGWNDENVYVLSSGNSFEECASEAGVVESYGNYDEETGKYVLTPEQVKQTILGSEADGDSSYGLAYVDLAHPENNLGNVTLRSDTFDE